MPPKCIVCQEFMSKNRSILYRTCKPVCSKIYMRIRQHLKSNMNNKLVSENKKLKEKLKVMENDKC